MKRFLFILAALVATARAQVFIPIEDIATMTSAQLAARVSDKSGSGALLFAGGNIGAATGTSLATTGNLTTSSGRVGVGTASPITALANSATKTTSTVSDLGVNWNLNEAATFAAGFKNSNATGKGIHVEAGAATADAILIDNGLLRLVTPTDVTVGSLATGSFQFLGGGSITKNITVGGTNSMFGTSSATSTALTVYGNSGAVTAASTNPNRLILRDSGSDGGALTWSTTQPWAALDFVSDDTSGVGGTSTTRARIATVAASNNHGNTDLVVYTENAEKLRVSGTTTKVVGELNVQSGGANDYLRLGNAIVLDRASASGNITLGPAAAATTVPGNFTVTASADASNFNSAASIATAGGIAAAKQAVIRGGIKTQEISVDTTTDNGTADRIILGAVANSATWTSRSFGGMFWGGSSMFGDSAVGAGDLVLVPRSSAASSVHVFAGNGTPVRRLSVSGSDGGVQLTGTKLTMNAAASRTEAMRQQVTGSVSAAATTVAKKILLTGPTYAGHLTITALQSNDQTHAAIWSGSVGSAYGATAAFASTSSVVGNISAISVTYDNGGSPAYTLNVTLTYTGAAPVIYYTFAGHSFTTLSPQ